MRQGFTGYESDGETGLEYAQARMVNTRLGRFTSVDPLFITPERKRDPQQVNLYAYVRNNPLNLTDPSGEDINDDHLKDNEEYQQWKAALLATKSGRELWDKYHNNKGFQLNIVWEKGKNGARTDGYTFADGKLTGATITLGSAIEDGGSRPPDQYPITSALSNASVDNLTMAIAIFAHEFGHVEDAAARPEMTEAFQDYTEYTVKRVKELTTKNRIDVKALDADTTFAAKRDRALKLGGYDNMNAATIDKDRRAERVMVPVIQERLGKDMPKSVRKAIERFK